MQKKKHTHNPPSPAGTCGGQLLPRPVAAVVHQTDVGEGRSAAGQPDEEQRAAPEGEGGPVPVDAAAEELEGRAGGGQL